ncbi:hypothetical protein HN011_004123 [Eciton burchellii]|nr:hypothetical protein HN011_004123 [Eciton burchellii]
MNLGCQIDNWDPFLVTIMSEKFGPETDAKWSEHLDASKKSPSYKELSEFLNCHTLSLPTSKLLPLSITRKKKVVPLCIMSRYETVSIVTARMA